MRTNDDSIIIHMKPLIRLNKKYVLFDCGKSTTAHKYISKLEGIHWSKYRKQYVMDYDWDAINSIMEQIQKKDGWVFDYSAFVIHNKQVIEQIMDETSEDTIHKLQRNRSKTLLKQKSTHSEKKQQNKEKTTTE